MIIVFSAMFVLLVLASAIAAILHLAGAGNGVKSKTAAHLAIAALMAGTAAAVVVWHSGSPLTLNLTRFSAFTMVLSIDRLGSVFLFLVCAFSMPAVAYSIPYVAHGYEDARSTWYWVLLPLFLLSMALVVAGASVFAFFVGWELMTLLSAALIVLEGDSAARRRSIFTYLLMMHTGAALVISAFLLFSPLAPALDFASIKAASATLPESLRAAIFLLAFFGFGMKAGVIPLHVWLPKAHPIAPTPISALMSSVMLKTAVYAFLRFVFDFLGGGPVWGGYLVLAAGAVSCVLGILYALCETDLKRLLAYSSVENIGIIYLTIGGSLLCLKNGVPAIAAMLLLAALVHCLTHAMSKSLLFMGAGAIHYRTHTFDLNEMGGLHRTMPRMAALFLIGCASIAGLPLFGGFVSEWIAFQGFLAGAQLPAGTAHIVLPLMAGVLALTAGLAAACFVNVYGSAFLGRPRKADVSAMEDVPHSILVPIGLLAAACAMTGTVAWLLIRPLWSLVMALVPGADYTNVAGIGTGISKVAAFVLVGVTVAGSLRVVIRKSAIWGCGLPKLTSRMEYSASCFSKPIRTVFGTIYKADRKLDVQPNPYFATTISYQSRRTTSYEQTLYRPLFDSILRLAQQLRRMQTGNIQLYLLYIFLALLSMLLLMRFR